MSIVKDCDIYKLVQTIFNLEVSNATRLTGYDDINYAVEAKSLTSNEFGKYVLKIVNVNDSATPKLTEAIMTVLSSLPAMNHATPKPILSRNGRFVEHTSITGVSRKVVLLTYLSGLNMKQLLLSQDNFSDLCKSVGSCAGSLATQLCNLSSTITPVPLRPDDVYMTENLHFSRNKLHYISNRTIKDISSQIMDIIESVSKIRPPLTKSLIHHDLCLENMIYSSTTDCKYVVHGVIDFSDMTFGYSIFDAAIPIASCMYQTYFINEPSDFDAARLVLSEFERQYPLSCNEKDFLYYAVMARFVSLRVLGGYDVLHNSETAEHEEHESGPLEHFIEKLWTAGKSKFDRKVLQ